MRRNGTSGRISQLSGLTVLCIISALTFGFYVSSVEAAPFAYVTGPSPFSPGSRSGTVSVFDTATNTVVATISVNGRPIGVAVTPDGKRAYMVIRSTAGGIVSVLDTATNTVVATVRVTDWFISGVAITPDGKHAYVTINNDTVKVLDTVTNTVVATVPEENSIGVAITPNGKHAYVTTSDGVTVIDTAVVPIL